MLAPGPRWPLFQSLLLVGLIAATAGASFAGNGSAESDESPEGLTRRLVALDAQHRAAPAARKAGLRTQLLATAATRQDLLEALVETDPGEVLRVSIPGDVRADLSPEVQPYVEEEAELEGELEVSVEDGKNRSRVHYGLTDVNGRGFSLHYAAEPPDLLTGAWVRVKGVRVQRALALDSGSTSTTAVSSPPLTNAFGEQRTVVILVNFRDKATQPYSVSYARDVVFGTTNDWDFENSFGQAWLSGDVFGWYTIPVDSTSCSTSSIATYAKQAATAAGVDLSGYRRYVYAFPNNACSWWGYGSIGGNPSQAWVNGSLAVKVVSHEMGHNFGLYHANALECGTATIGNDCSSIEYGDPIDTMGNPRTGHFNAFQKERLGWLDYAASPAITTVSTGGTYSIDAYESPGSNPAALKILKSTDPSSGKKTWYYVELRQALGFDAFLAGNGNVLNGVVVHTGSESTGNSSYLLDMTPGTSSWNDPALVAGASFYDPSVGLTVAPASVSGGTAKVSVSFGPLACSRANPSVTLSPSQSQWVQRGATVTFTVSLTNEDNSGCAASTFDLTAAAPGGWVASFTAPALTLAPGASGSTALQVTSPASTADGFYTIGVGATNDTEPEYATWTSATYVIVSSLDVTVTTDQPSYKPGNWVTITVVVSSGGSPVSGAKVNFTVAKPKGKGLSASTNSASDGSATYRFKLGPKDAAGSYGVTVDASVGNSVFGSATTSFAVK